jgi:hypothetical protein
MSLRTILASRVFAGLAVPLLATGLLLTACSDDDGDDDPPINQTPTAGASTSNDEQAIETTIRNVVAAFNSANTEEFLKYWTDAGLEDEFGVTPDAVRQNAAEFFSDAPPGGLRLADFKSADVDGDKATAVFDFVFAQTLAPQEYSLVNQSNVWKINQTEPGEIDIPSGTTAVPLELEDFAFSFDEAEIEDGDVAFQVTNSGEQPHEVVILSVPDGFTVETLLSEQSQDLPAGVEFVGFLNPIGPNESANMVFEAPLPAGSYMMVCFLPDTSQGEDGPPHAVEGMVSTFQID